MVRISILSAAHVHIDQFAAAVQSCSGVELAGIFDDVKERGGAKADQYHSVYFETVQEALEQSEAVIVCSENAKHEELVMASLEAGKHVLCEKPLSTTVKSAESMAAKADQLALVLATAFPMRFNTPALAMKKALDHKRIGSIVAFHGRNQGQCPGGWFVERSLAGGGAVMDHTVHLLDMMRWYTGAEVTGVYAEIDSFLHSGHDIDDVGHIQLLFNNGIIADIDPSWSRPPGFPTWGGLSLRATGKEGTIDLDGFAQTISCYTHHRAHWQNWGDDEYRYMIDGFLRRIGNKPTEQATAWDGVAAVKVVEAAYLSAREGEVVSL